MDLILTEKPSVAKSFADALGAARQTGYFEKPGVARITWCFGHLLSLFRPEDYDAKYKTWSTDTLPILPPAFRYSPIASNKDHLAMVAKLIASASRVVLATDAGREGQLIGHEVLSWAKWTGPTMRFWSSEALTPEVVRANMSLIKPDSEYEQLLAEARGRQHADWLVGMNFTRFYSVRLSDTYSVGRVQTAILAILSRRELEVESFVPKDQYSLAGEFSAPGGRFTAVHFTTAPDGKRVTRFDERQTLENIRAKLAVPSPAELVDLVKETKIENAPALFSLTALQQEANRRFGFTAEQTLTYAQRLYEDYQVLSYPRTPSRVLASSSVPLVTSVIKKLSPAYASVFAGVKPELVSLANKRVFDDSKLEDHHALIPLSLPKTPLPEAEAKLFDLVVASFAAVFHESAEWSHAKAVLSASGVLFHVYGRQLAKPGWKAVFGAVAADDSDSDDESPLPPLEKGDFVELSSLEIKASKTTPPKRFTEATLLEVMEKPQRFFSADFLDDGTVVPGLGTQATRANIIETLLDRGYVERKKKLLIPTPKGRFLIKTIDAGPLAPLAQPEETTRWETLLAQDPEAFSRMIRDFVEKTIASLKTAPGFSVVDAPSIIGLCPACGSPVLDYRDRWVCSRATRGAGSTCSVSLGKEILSAKLTLSDAKALFAGRNSSEKHFVSHTGKKFDAALHLDRSGKIEFRFKDTPKK